MRQERPWRHWTSQQMIDWAMGFFEKEGHLPKQHDFEVLSGAPPLSAIYREFKYKSTFDEKVVAVMHGKPYPPEQKTPRRRWRESWALPEDSCVQRGIAWAKEHGEYPGIKALRSDNALPSEATVRRKFLTVQAYQLAIYAQAPWLGEPSFKGCPQRSHKGPKRHTERFGAEGLAGSPETWQLDSSWLGGVDMLQDDRLVLSGPCACEGCTEYRDNPLRRCTCDASKVDCAACATWFQEHQFLKMDRDWEEDDD